MKEPTTEELLQSIDGSLLESMLELGYNEDEAKHVLAWYEENLFTAEWDIDTTSPADALKFTGYKANSDD